METEIGQAAGTIWRHLADRHAATTVSDLKQATKLSDQPLLMGLGWLAREGKVTLIRHPRRLEVSLRESQTA
ncbi:MAG: winged helix-turn-helix domain-containing protein [Chloroflexota bacterium]